ncbi:hypothetical protein QQF64_033455 [Cirrhinus molitorella]|uniref:Secreted protein n=1 Tax=Cirrhinus molitorella TaxID=172907 RepID=A0ABR3MTY0_9TELE
MSSFYANREKKACASAALHHSLLCFAVLCLLCRKIASDFLLRPSLASFAGFTYVRLRMFMVYVFCLLLPRRGSQTQLCDVCCLGDMLDDGTTCSRQVQLFFTPCYGRKQKMMLFVSDKQA